jgi:DNA recombination protein RmuC
MPWPTWTAVAALPALVLLALLLRARSRAALLELRWQLGAEELHGLKGELADERALRQQAEAQAASLAAKVRFLAAAQSDLAELRAQRDALSHDKTRLVAELEAEHAKLALQRDVIEETRARLHETFRAVGAEALQQSSESFLQLAEHRFRQLLAEHDGRGEQQRTALHGLMGPLFELLEKQSRAVGELELKRESAYVDLTAQIRHVATAHEKLSSETGKLVSALANPAQRGRWGELQLQRVVELAGMVEHCDFDTQVHVTDGETTRRPDMIVHIPGGGQIIVDAKAPLDAYLRALATDADRRALLLSHARQVREHVAALASKRYWRQFERSPEMVVLFIPVESALSTAMEVDATLHAQALENRVLIATPMLLVALLRAVAYGWQQDAIADSARQIARVGGELHERIALFVDHLCKLGRSLQAGTNAYNDALGSLERRVLVSARRLRELGATRADDIEAPPTLQLAIRGLSPLLDEEASAAVKEPS